MNKENKKSCIQTDLADYCFDQEVMADPEYDDSDKNNILNAPDDADLDHLKNMGIVEDLLTQGTKK